MILQIVDNEFLFCNLFCLLFTLSLVHTDDVLLGVIFFHEMFDFFFEKSFDFSTFVSENFDGDLEAESFLVFEFVVLSFDHLFDSLLKNVFGLFNI